MVTDSLLESFIGLVDELEDGQLTSREKFILTTAIWAGSNVSDPRLFSHLSRITKVILGPKNIRDTKKDSEMNDLIKKVNKFDN